MITDILFWLLVWFLVSIPVAILVGKFIAVGSNGE